MSESQVHLAYAPRGAGLLCALFWFVGGDDVYGWFTGARAHELPAAFFMLENYRSRGQTICYRSADNDLYGDWLVMTAKGESKIDPPLPVPDAVCHELDRLQDAFVREWLFYEDDPEHASESAQLRARELPVLAVNVRPGKINKLTTGELVWTYSSPGADLNVAVDLARLWPLDHIPSG
jgi:hypothetical protein